MFKEINGYDEPKRTAAFLPDFLYPNVKSGAITDGKATFTVPLNTGSWQTLCLETRQNPRKGAQMLSDIVKLGRKRLPSNHPGKEQCN